MTFTSALYRRQVHLFQWLFSDLHSQLNSPSGLPKWPAGVRGRCWSVPDSASPNHFALIVLQPQPCQAEQMSIFHWVHQSSRRSAGWDVLMCSPIHGASSPVHKPTCAEFPPSTRHTFIYTLSPITDITHKVIQLYILCTFFVNIWRNF